MENSKVGPNVKCFKGGIITVNSILGLHKYIFEKYQIKYLMTSHVDQDYVEVGF